MKYTKEQRLDIGRRIYDGEITKYQAADVYDISDETAKNYMRQYREKIIDKGAESNHASHKIREITRNYTKAERLDIGRQIYEGEITRYQAAEMYNIGDDTARRYMRQYRDTNHLPPKQRGIASKQSRTGDNGAKTTEDSDQTENGIYEKYERMSKRELIQNLFQLHVIVAQLKNQLLQFQNE